MISLAGPFAGAIHDQNVFDTSEVIVDLHQCLDFSHIEERIYAIYGDPAYKEDRCLIKPFRTGNSLLSVSKYNYVS